MRRASALLAALALLLVTAAPASANDDPHRSRLTAVPFDLPGGLGGICAFPVHVAFPVLNMYGTTSYLPDGTRVLTVTGKEFISATNLDTLKTITVNTFSPGTFMWPLDGKTMIWDGHGPGWFEAPNLAADYGFPSNFVVVAGSAHVVQDLATGDYISLSGHLNVLTDVCAALS